MWGLQLPPTCGNTIHIKKKSYLLKNRKLISKANLNWTKSMLFLWFVVVSVKSKQTKQPFKMYSFTQRVPPLLTLFYVSLFMWETSQELWQGVLGGAGPSYPCRPTDSPGVCCQGQDSVQGVSDPGCHSQDTCWHQLRVTEINTHRNKHTQISFCCLQITSQNVKHAPTNTLHPAVTFTATIQNLHLTCNLWNALQTWLPSKTVFESKWYRKQ